MGFKFVSVKFSLTNRGTPLFTSRAVIGQADDEHQIEVTSGSANSIQHHAGFDANTLSN